VSANPDLPDAGATDSAVPDAASPSDRPESPPSQRPWYLSLNRFGLDRFGLDRFGFTQAIGGFVLGLIALFSSYDHITLAGHSIGLQQQWGIPCIAASVATIFLGACNTARQLSATLNWRRDPGYEQRKMQHELRMKQLKSEIEQIKKESEQL
jgi:hypothetical protein